MRADQFLDLYRNLERSLKQNRSYYDSKYDSPIVRFANSIEGRAYKEDLVTIREIRNLLVHTPKIENQYPLEPSDELIQILQEIIKVVENPVRAVDIMTPISQILMADLDDEVLTVMNQMEERGFSHAPVLENGVMIGVFSKSTVFTWLLQQEGAHIRRDMRISAFSAMLPLKNHIGDVYEYGAENLLAAEVQMIFERQFSVWSQRLSVLFITKTGSRSEVLEGMITPWDVLGKEKR